MPLFIDLHVDPSLTPEEVKQCHVADKKIQEKYGVRYLQILLNQPQGHLFCLVEGPDKETCARVHHEAHGNVACNILEITESDFSGLLIGKQKDGHDFTLNTDGTIDTGVRAILTFSIVGTPQESDAAKPLILEALHQHGGRNTESLLDPATTVFNSCTTAIDAAIEVIENIEETSINAEIRLGISIGMPLGKEGNYFEEARKSAAQFAFVADKNAIAITANARKLYNGNAKITDDVFKILSLPEEKFLTQLIDYLERTWASPDLDITTFASEMGMSKSQLSRKLKSVTPLSPNDLIKEFRLRKSIELMHEQGMNVAEVTMAIGFSNPSYFTKCFRSRFGQSPTEYLSTK